MPNIVKLKGNPIVKEAVAAGAITPGHLLERTSAGKYAVHSVAAGNAAPLFADVADVIGNGLDDAYAADDQVKAIFCEPGAEVYALVAANAAAVADGAYLESAGDGTLRVLTTAAATEESERSSVVARAIEAVDNSAGGSPARIKVEVL